MGKSISAVIVATVLLFGGVGGGGPPPQADAHCAAWAFSCRPESLGDCGDMYPSLVQTVCKQQPLHPALCKQIGP